jgi:mRNA interferase MazF
MEKIWTGEVRIKYPLQWIVMVNLSHEKKGCKTMGEVYFVTSDQDEAYAKAKELGDTMGENMVIRGHNPYQSEIGGLNIWNSLCLSNRIISQTSNIAVFAPISNTNRDYPFYYPLENLGALSTGKILLDQLVAIDYNARNFSLVEKIKKTEMKKILAITKLVFDENHEIP